MRSVILMLLAAVIVLFTITSCRSVEIIAQTRATTTPETPTPRPRFTPKPTATSLPTASPTQRRTPTPRPTTRTTIKPAVVVTPLPTQIVPTRSQFSFRVDNIRCYHSGQSFGEGLVLEKADDPNSGINGLKVRMSAEPGGVAAGPDYETQDHYLDDARLKGNFSGYFSFIVNAFGAAPGQVRYFRIVDNSGKPLSDPSAGRAVFNNLVSEDACWNVQIIFVKIP